MAYLVVHKILGRHREDITRGAQGRTFFQERAILTVAQSCIQVAVGGVVQHQEALVLGYAVTTQGNQVTVAHAAKGAQLSQKLPLADALQKQEKVHVRRSAVFTGL
jgi:hypothetical protein